MRLNASRPEHSVAWNRLSIAQEQAMAFDSVNLGVRPNTNPEPSENRLGVEPWYRWKTRKYSATGFEDAYSTPAESPAGFCRCLDPRWAASDDDEIPALTPQPADGPRKSS